MGSKLPESPRLTYARQLADEAKTLVPGMERLSAIAEELRADDLYRLLGFDTWERFCSDYLGVSKRTANRWIAGQKPKSIAAGQSVAAGQNVPVVESEALNSANQSEGKNGAGSLPHSAPGDSAARPGSPSGPSSAGSGPGMPQTRPGVAAPAGPSSGGAEVQPSAGPTGEESAGPSVPVDSSPSAPSDPSDDVPGSPDPALQRPLNPPELEADAPVDVDAIGLRWLQSKNDRQVRALADPLGGVIRAEVKRWAAAFGYVTAAPPAPAEKPQRRPGALSAAVGYNGSARITPTAARAGGKRHANDCRCLSCATPKAAAK